MSLATQLTSLPNTPQERPDHERAPDARSGQAWMREMERAQLSNWFASTTVESHAASTLRQVTQAAALPPQARSAVPIRLEWTAYVRAPASAAAPALMSSTAAPPAALGRATPNKQLLSTPVEHTAPPEQTRSHMTRLIQQQLHQALVGAQAAATPLAVQQNQAPLRLHLETGANGVSAWIGTELDKATLQQHLSLLLDTLRRSLHSQGLRLHSLTLNGRTLWQPSASDPPFITSEETPWPSTQ